MKKILIFTIIGMSSLGCKNVPESHYYKYHQEETLNLPSPSTKTYLLEVLKDSENLIITENNVFTPRSSSFGFIGFYQTSDSLIKFWGIDTTKINSSIKVAISYFRHFNTLPQPLFNTIKDIKAPSVTYMLFYLDSITVEELLNRYIDLYKELYSLDETETYYLIKIMYEIKKRTQRDLPQLDSTINLYLRKWPYGKHAARLYYYMLTNKKINQDTMLNVYKNLIVKNPTDEYALQFLVFFADTSIKGNKDKRYLKDLLKTIKKIPITSVSLQLSFYIPEIFPYIDEEDTLNILKRTFINGFGSPPYLVELWATADLIEYHFAKGYYLKRNKKFNEAIVEFKKCDNYSQPNYYKEEKDRQIIEIYKLLGRYNSKECKSIAIDLLSKNPSDTIAKKVLNNPSLDSIFSLIKPILMKRKQSIPEGMTFELLNGKKLTWKDFMGKAWVIKFWSVYCPHCKKGIPLENELYLELKNKNEFNFLACSTNPKKVVKKFLERNAFYFEQAHSCNPLRASFKVSGVPAYFVLDKKGNIIFSHIGKDSNLKERLRTELFIASKL